MVEQVDLPDGKAVPVGERDEQSIMCACLSVQLRPLRSKSINALGMMIYSGCIIAASVVINIIRYKSKTKHL